MELRSLLLVLVMLLPAAPAMRAQEALRASLAGQEAAEARKRALANQRFNLKLGPVSLRFNATAAVEASDNIRAQENDPQADAGFRGQLNTFALWRVTERNSLTLGLGVGYLKYINTPEYDSVYVTPDTDLSFDLYAGDFLINFHDRFDYTQDVTADPTVSGIGSLSRFENTAGVKVLWDLNKAVLSLGFDHRDFIATDSRYAYLSHTAELASLTAGFELNPTLQAGLELSGGLLAYDESERRRIQDNQHFAVGPFLSGQLSEYTAFQFGAGYVLYFLDELAVPGSFTNAATTLDAVYVSASLRQQVGQFLDHSLRLSRSVQSGIASELLDLWRVEHWAAWRIVRDVGVTTSLSYEHGRQPGLGGETLDRYGAGISLARPLTRKAAGRVGYQVYYKQSDQPNRGYLQNRLVLDLTYAF